MSALALTVALAVAAGGPAAGAPAPVRKPLHPAEARASSYLKSNWAKYEENYHPNYAIDGDPKTAWVEGADGDGKGAWLEMPTTPMESARSVALQIASGYQKSQKLLVANAAPKSVTVVVMGPSGAESGRATATLEKTMGKQIVPVRLALGIARVRIVVDEVHPGTLYSDLCISDVELFVDADAYLASIESAKKSELLAWKKERLETAKYFARLPKDYPFASRDFNDVGRERPAIARAAFKEATPGPGGHRRVADAERWTVKALMAAKNPVLAPLAAEDRADIEEILALRDARSVDGAQPPAGALARRAEPTGGRMRLPDGLFHLRELSHFFALDRVVFSESPAGKNQTVFEAYADGKPRTFMTTEQAWVWKRPDGSVERLFLPATHRAFEGFEFVTRAHWLFRYDERGALERASVVELETPAQAGPPMERFLVFRFEKNADGKISAVRGFSSYGACVDREGNAGCAYRLYPVESVAAAR